MSQEDSFGANPLRGIRAWGTHLGDSVVRRRGSNGVYKPIMAEQQLGGEFARAAVDRTPGVHHGGSVGFVVLIAVALVCAASAVIRKTVEIDAPSFLSVDESRVSPTLSARAGIDTLCGKSMR